MITHKQTLCWKYFSTTLYLHPLYTYTYLSWRCCIFIRELNNIVFAIVSIGFVVNNQNFWLFTTIHPSRTLRVHRRSKKFFIFHILKYLIHEISHYCYYINNLSYSERNTWGFWSISNAAFILPNTSLYHVLLLYKLLSYKTESIQSGIIHSKKQIVQDAFQLFFSL